MFDKNKCRLKDGDLFRFNWWENIYRVKKGWEKFTWYTVKTRKDFNVWDLNDFMFEIVGNEKDWIDTKYEAIMKRYWERKGFRFLDS